MSASLPSPSDQRRALVVRALRRYRARLARRLEALRGDLAEASRAPEYRKFAETLLAYLPQVPKRAVSVSLPDPFDPAKGVEIPLDPLLNPPENAARHYTRAAKYERALAEVPPRLAAVEADLHALEVLLERADRFDEHGPRGGGQPGVGPHHRRTPHP